MPQYKDVNFRLIRSARRSVAIYVERDGTVSVRAPQAATDEQIQRVVERKRPWIYRNLALWKELNPVPVAREMVSGESFYFLGQPCVLDIRKDAEKPLTLDGDRFILRADRRAKADELIRAFYRRAGYERLPGLIAAHARSMGVKPGKLRVWELKHRWASCSPAGNLNFHWRALSAPLDVLEYLVVHELAHLKERGHTPRFWKEVEKVMPDWKGRAEWLKRNGAAMTL